MHFGCTLQEEFPGTLFRLPLRTAAIAAKSEIRQHEYTPHEVVKLFVGIQKLGAQVLLFLKNVRCLQLYVKKGIEA